MNRRRFLQSVEAAALAAPLALKAQNPAVWAEVHISLSGDDYNVGTPAAPVRILARALQLSRECKRDTGLPASLLLHGGVYELPVPLWLRSVEKGMAVTIAD